MNEIDNNEKKMLELNNDESKNANENDNEIENVSETDGLNDAPSTKVEIEQELQEYTDVIENDINESGLNKSVISDSKSE
jgi:hypothetical protein